MKITQTFLRLCTAAATVTAIVVAANAHAESAAPSAAAGDAHGAGKALFQKNCAACHQATGKGIPGAFPALAGNPFVQGPAQDVATVLLQGRGGMPDFSSSLSDEDIAAVLSFARSAWGNKAAPLAGDDVGALRGQLGLPGYAAGQMSNKH
jgi:mono/diheme cytochrome c family protein